MSKAKKKKKCRKGVEQKYYLPFRKKIRFKKNKGNEWTRDVESVAEKTEGQSKRNIRKRLVRDNAKNALGGIIFWTDEFEGSEEEDRH